MQTVDADTRSPRERLIARDALVLVIGVAAITALAWAYLVRMAASMHSDAMTAGMHAAMGMPEVQTWSAAELLALFLMWTVMMVGMMLPSATPVMLLVLGVYRRRGGGAGGGGDGRRSHVSSVAFSAGYLLAWMTFSAVAATAQVVLHRVAWLSPDMAGRSAVLVGAILVVAGVYQWLPLKTACLAHCRSPLEFLTRHWREGPTGGLAMGLHHGLFCVGCCWALMALLFVVGVMNLLWVAAIAVFVLVEKLARHGPLLGRVAGALLMAWGTYVLVRSI